MCEAKPCGNTTSMTIHLFPPWALYWALFSLRLFANPGSLRLTLWTDSFLGLGRKTWWGFFSASMYQLRGSVSPSALRESDYITESIGVRLRLTVFQWELSAWFNSLNEVTVPSPVVGGCLLVPGCPDLKYSHVNCINYNSAWPMTLADSYQALTS